MSVKAKFLCNSITNFGHFQKAELSAVYGNSEENKDFSTATPSGNISISISNGTPASDFFNPQKQYYVTFEEDSEA